MAIYEFWCENCQITYTEERPMTESNNESMCAKCNNKADRRYNINTIFKGSGFYSTDKNSHQKGK